MTDIERKAKKAAYSREYRSIHHAKVAAYNMEYNVLHKAERTAYDTTYRMSHKEKLKEKGSKYRATHKAEISVSGIKYYLAHQDQIAIKWHEWCITHQAEIVSYRKNHIEANELHNAKRRALKYDNTPINELLTETQWKTLLAKYNGHCAYCDKEAKLTLDHVIPLSKGGKHSIDNVVPACLHCNSSKGARTPEQWLQSLITGHGSDASKSVREQSLVLEGD